MDFDQHTIRAAFEDKPLKRECPACGGREWDVGAVFMLPALNLPEGPATAIQAEETEPTKGELRMQGAAVAPRMCVGCGYAQLFDVATLLRG